MTIPKQFRPTKLEDFIGPARVVADDVVKAARLFGPAKVPAMFLFYGEPGTAKTCLSKFTLSIFGVQPANLVEYSGTDFNIEAVRRWSDSIQQSSLFEGYRGLWVDMPREAQVRFLKTCDQVADQVVSVRNGVVIAATCNSDVAQLEKRFQSRFQTFCVHGPKGEEMIPLLERWLPPESARHLANLSTGRVLSQRVDLRAVLNDATTMLLKTA
jgi:replication-associated recombination protein RarA